MRPQSQTPPDLQGTGTRPPGKGRGPHWLSPDTRGKKLALESQVPTPLLVDLNQGKAPQRPHEQAEPFLHSPRIGASKETVVSLMPKI